MRHRRAPILATLVAVIGLSSIPAAPVAVADDAMYYLPAPEGTELVVSQGNGPGDGRVAGQRYAFDLVAAGQPERFPVVAARGGTVMGQRVGVTGGRCNEPLDGPRPSCWRELNYVLIDHGDGTSALYSHLKKGEPVVRSGDVVSAGQPIGVAGSSGWTDHVGLGFAVQETPTWNEWGGGGWFETTTLPISFADADVRAQRADGVPQTDDVVLSGNPGSRYEPFRFRPRPLGLPASVPFEDGVEHELSAAYEADSADGYGLHFAAPDGTATDVRPLFGGQLEFAGCATGASASLGRTVAVRFEVEGMPYLALHSHLSDIEPALLEADPGQPQLIIGPADTIGQFGSSEQVGDDSSLECPAADADRSDLFVTILRNGSISPEGEIMGGTPVSPEPLVGERGYEGFAWWSGPVAAVEVLAEAARPSVRWNAKTPASGSHIRFGDTVRLKARVRDITDIAEVRFRAWYPRWPQVKGSTELESFDPATSWRQLAVCLAPKSGRRGTGNLCAWDGHAQDAKVTYIWDPTAAKPMPSAPWLPRARAATSRRAARCVPVSLAVEVIDRAGHVYSDITSLPLPSSCDDRAAEATDGARLLYLDPLVPPQAPTARGKVSDRGWPPVYESDPLDGAIAWRDRSDNEDGFRIYARRKWFETDCSVTTGLWQLIHTSRPNKVLYRPNHRKVVRSIPAPKIEGVPGAMTYWEYSVSAFNEAGETRRQRVGGFLGGSEAFCDSGGLLPPPELEP